MMLKGADLSRTEWEHLIQEYVFNEVDRDILRRRLLDGIPFEPLAEEFSLSVQAVKRRVYKSMDKLSKHIK